MIKTRCSICGKNQHIYDVAELNGTVVILCHDCLRALKKKPGQKPLAAPASTSKRSSDSPDPVTASGITAGQVET